MLGITGTRVFGCNFGIMLIALVGGVGGILLVILVVVLLFLHILECLQQEARKGERLVRLITQGGGLSLKQEFSSIYLN